MRSLIAIFIVALFCSCSVRNFDLAEFQKSEFLVEINGVKNVLYVSHKGEEYQFLLFDSLGIPLSSKVLRQGRFESQKFLRPNFIHNKIFTEVLEMLEAKEKQREITINTYKIEVKKL